MTRKELAEFLKEHRVPGKLYSLNGSKKGRICLEKEKDGYSIYFFDKKQKVGTLHYGTEADACRGMVREMDKLMRGLFGLRFAV